MKPANEEQLKDLIRDCEQFQKIGTGAYKAAYCALEGRGYTETEPQPDGSVFALRPSDNTYVSVSVQSVPVDKVVTVLENQVTFSTGKVPV